MSNLICHSCGSSSSPDGSAAFVNCQYCGASISVASFFKDSSTDTLAAISDAGLSEEESKKISRLFEDAEHQIKVSEYATARGNFEEILKIYPRHIPSRMNLANCLLFDTEQDPLERGKRVRDHLINASADHQEIPEIIELKDSIAFNIASMGKNNTDGMQTIELFKISKQVSEKNEERDELIREFYEKLSPKITSRMQDGLKKLKGKFSPSITDLTIMIEGSSYEPSIKSLCTQMYQHMKKNKNKIHKRSLEMLDALEAVCDISPKKVEPIEKGSKGSKTIWIVITVIIISTIIVFIGS